MDRYLDTTRRGPLWLLREDVASLVCRRIGECSGDSCELYAWVVMANHVHILMKPLINPSELLRRIKGRTAREANLLIGRTGEPFWQGESYDRWMRTADEIGKTSRYIENNPVFAGLVGSAEDYRWSSAYRARAMGAEARQLSKTSGS